jgi:hypothetical protein
VTDFAHEGVTIRYPAGWTRDADGEQQGKADGIVLLAKGDSGVDGLPYVLTVLDQPRESRTVRGMGKLVSDTRPSDLRGQHVSDGPIDVAGTPEAWRVVTDYQARPKEGGDVTTLRWIDVVWLDGDRQLGVRLVGPRDKMEAPEVQKIVDSLKAG